MHTGGMACPGPPRTRDLGPQHTPPPTSSHLLEQGPYEASVQPGWVGLGCKPKDLDSAPLSNNRVKNQHAPRAL